MLRPETVERALREIEKGYAEYRYFFEHLNSPAWLRPLAERGRFRQPPPAVRDGQYISFPGWPESRYLLRMAHLPEAQETVLNIVLEIPATENSRVNDDISDIALTLPPRLSARLVPLICASIQHPVKLLLPEKIANLIPYLAKGGQGEAALKLTYTALALTSDSEAAEKEGEESVSWPEPQPQFENWYYERIVERAIPALVDAVGLPVLKLCCDLLSDAITFAQKPTNEGDEDYLYIPHPAVEQGASPDNIPCLLLCATRDAAEQLIAKDRSQFSTVLEILRAKKWISFRRLELHLIRLFLDQARDLAENVFQDPQIVNHPSLHHEAVLLLKAAFPALKAATREKVLNWIDQGPAEESVRQWLKFVGVPVTQENLEAHRDRWRRDRFAIVEGDLPEPYRRRYDELKTALGGPRKLEQPNRPRFGAIGPLSPKSAEDLAEMEIEEVLTFLGSWVPGTDIFAPTAAGLGQILTVLVSQRPRDFAASAQRFVGLDPTYVRCFFDGLTSALKQGASFDWPPVLELANWVANQQREIPGRKGDHMVTDPHWGWARDSVIDLITTGFEDRDGLPLQEHRHALWRILIPLTDDPKPSLDDETGENFDPSSLSINSTRGRAFHATIQYALWVRQHMQASQQAEDNQPITFSAMPEVRQVLEAHLEVDREPTLTIRSVYGRWLPWLAGMDRDWFDANLHRILPTDSDSLRFRAAWESFVVFCNPNTALLPLLVAAYQKAIEQVGTVQSMMRDPAKPNDRLAEHLMVYYWLGRLEFGSQDRLLDQFYATASDELRGHATWFIGTSVSHWDEAPPPEVIRRLRNLIEMRLHAVHQSSSPEMFSKELVNFGRWFTSNRFEEGWGIETLLSILRITKKINSETDVVKRLVELCPRYPDECISCLRLMIEGDRDGWLLVGVEEDVRSILRLVVDGNNPGASLSARRLTEELIARGNFGFRDLLR